MTIAIIGAGLTGASAAAELREQGYEGDIVLVGAEPHAPYERPPLSKDILLGTGTAADAAVKDADWYEQQRIELITGSEVSDLDPAARTFVVDGRTISYDELLVATGATSRHLPMVDESGAPFAYLRTIEESEALRKNLSGRLLVIGAGWIGLEVASAARQAGGTVTVVEAAATPLSGPIGPEMAEVFAGLHREHGVDLRTSTSVTAIEHGEDRALRRDEGASKGSTRATLSDGTEVVADIVLVAIGAQPEVALAQSAGLDVDNGILVDERLRTSDPHVFAAGDVANHDHPTVGRVRVEHWDSAIHQGRHAARSMLGGQEAYTRQPYFFTDQYDLGMEYIGHLGPDGYDEVVIRGDRDSRVLNALMITSGRVVAGMHTNDWDATDHLRACVGNEATDALRDVSIPLAQAHG
ncbi:NAD(P)/FAD-dependent oxidoreductase [Janibacter cremeus]|uniref:NADPH-dependent 2,4-dienoyl-CoA reductase/sulfur reductase-like enzyme n=1 Tax=Janibacter cremeus TaxID=1285192 RepID=A0A852VMQ6_9MICO|nr:FAD-dependent oxidoreductase [Janibacter cremeus]NYF98347.1 NADPH-dependent 2,4-dienoyl-CoA reductase/sulfur reductase-like enzyme [Janibacter cremeus]